MFYLDQTNQDGEQYLVRKYDKTKQDEMMIDSIRDCKPDEDPRLCHQHRPFQAVGDGISTNRGYMFYFDQTDKAPKSSAQPKRVLISSLKGKEKYGCYKAIREEHVENINFPSNSSQDVTGAYMQVGSDRRQMQMTTFKKNENENVNKENDYFWHLPLGIIKGNAVFLLSDVQRRVYIFDYEQYKESMIGKQARVSKRSSK